MDVLIKTDPDVACHVSPQNAEAGLPVLGQSRLYCKTILEKKSNNKYRNLTLGLACSRSWVQFPELLEESVPRRSESLERTIQSAVWIPTTNLGREERPGRMSVLVFCPETRFPPEPLPEFMWLCQRKGR